MNYTKLIKKLRSITLDEKSFLDKEQHYRLFAIELHSFFMEEMRDRYLLSFPFISEKGEQKNPSHKFLISDDLPPWQREKIEKHLIAGEQVLKKGALSLTKIMIENLIEEEIQSLLLKNKDDLESIQEKEVLKEYFSELIFIDLKQDFIKAGEFTEYFGETAVKLNVQENDYAELYKRLVQFRDVPAPGHWFYLIKPTANHKHFNVVLVLAVREPLTAFEFHLLRLLIYRFVSEVAIKELQEDERTIHSNYIFGIGHFLKHRVNPVLSNLVRADEILRQKYGIQNELQVSLSLARTALFSASVLDLYGKAISKRLKDENYAEFSDKSVKRYELVGEEDEVIQKELEDNYLSDKDLNIKNLINDIVDLIKRESSKEIQTTFDTETNWNSLVIEPFIKYETKTHKCVFFRPAEKIYHQFLHELFKNVDKSLSPMGLKVKINYLKNENCIIFLRVIDEKDAMNLERTGIGYEEYSFVKGEEISGLSLMQHYLDVLGLGTISHKLIKGTRTRLGTKLILNGLLEGEGE